MEKKEEKISCSRDYGLRCGLTALLSISAMVQCTFSYRNLEDNAFQVEVIPVASSKPKKKLKKKMNVCSTRCRELLGGITGGSEKLSICLKMMLNSEK
jgi:hypothetical protein